MRMYWIVGIREIPTLDDLRSNRTEISRQDRAIIAHHRVLLVGGCSSLPVVVVPVARVVQRKVRNGRHGLGARQAGYCEHDVTKCLVVRNIHAEREDVAGLKTRIYPQDAGEGTNEQSGTDQ